MTVQAFKNISIMSTTIGETGLFNGRSRMLGSSDRHESLFLYAKGQRLTGVA